MTNTKKIARDKRRASRRSAINKISAKPRLYYQGRRMIG